MKVNLLTALLCLSTLFSFGQAATTKIFVVKNGAQTLGPTQFYTTLDANQVIRVNNRGYVLIETDADSLGIYRDNSGADDQPSVNRQSPVFIQLEKGKAYYFKIGPLMNSQNLDVEEMTERAFQLYVGLNGLGNHPKIYTLGRSKLSLKNPQ